MKETEIKHHVRFARPTNNLEDLVDFYTTVLGFENLASFRDHGGFDGEMLRHEALGYHIEFTRKRGHVAPQCPSPEHFIVFYVPDATERQSLLDRFARAGCRPVKPFNPYLDGVGTTFNDPDGYGIVIVSGSWKQ